MDTNSNEHKDNDTRDETQGEWYVIHTYSGYENKVKTNLEPVSYTHLDVYKRQL